MGLLSVMAYSRRLGSDCEAFLVRCDLTGRESSAVLCSFAGVGYEKKRAMALAKAVNNARAQGFVTSFQVSPSSLHAANFQALL